MDKITTVVLLLTAACFTTGQDADPLTVEIEGEPKHEVTTGTSLVFKCIINSGLFVTLRYAPEWWHQSLVDPDNPKEVLLTNMEALKDAASPDDFDIKAEYGPDHLHLILTVKSVKVKDDGKFICRLTPLSAGDDPIYNDVEVVVVNDVEDVALTFDGEPAVTGEVDTAVELEEGEYGVTCMATGFSPSASIKIYVGDEELPTGGADSTFDVDASAAAGARRYKAWATVGAASLRADHSGKTLRCEAQASYDGAAKLVASVPLSVIALEPTITCDKNASAHPGDLYVKITCEVDHSNVKVVAYSFEIGDTGDIIFPGNMSKSYDEVTLKYKDPYTTVVILDLYQAKEMYFDTVFYLNVKTESGQTFREKATLIRLEPTITCDKNASAYPGDLYVKIACEVDHSKVKVVAYSFEIGVTGDIIFPGNVSKSYDLVTLKEIDPDTTLVTLDLYQAKEMYFDTAYYLNVKTEHGHTFRKKATLIRLDPTGAASAVSVSKAAVLCLSFLLSLLLSL